METRRLSYTLHAYADTTQDNNKYVIGKKGKGMGGSGRNISFENAAGVSLLSVHLKIREDGG